jgi:nucleoside-diphosphate-sugar epimerase
MYLKNFVDVLVANDMVPERFLYMSSLSALGPGDEENYTPLTSKAIPIPNTRYGTSKIKAETYLQTITNFPYIIFRPTGVYGPHEKDYLMMIQSIDSHFDFGVGYRKQVLTFIYVEDLVNAMFDAFAAGVVGKKYIISEDRSYTQKEFRSIVSKHLNKKWVIPVKLPMWIVYIASVVAEKWGIARMKPSTLNRDKFKIMKQRNWACDVTDAKQDFGFNPQFSLDRGIEITVKAYLDENSTPKVDDDFNNHSHVAGLSVSLYTLKHSARQRIATSHMVLSPLCDCFGIMRLYLLSRAHRDYGDIVAVNGAVPCSITILGLANCA